MTATPRSVLVTGTAGQDGSFLAERLAAEGYRVVGLVRPGGSSRPGAWDARSIDLGDAAAVFALMEELRPERVFHVAAVHHASDVPLTADPVLWRAMTTVNFIATTHLIQAILAVVPRARLVYAASSQMYRGGEGGRMIDENTPRDPPTWYGLTKSWSVDAIRFARERHGLHGASAILFNHESERRPETFVSRKITRAAARIAKGSGETLRLRNIGAMADWCDAIDVVDAMVRMAEAEEPADCVVGSGVLSRVRDMVEAAFTAAGLDWRAHVVFDEDAARPTVRADISRIRRLGWEPRTSIADVIRRMVAADLASLGGAHER